MGGYKALNISYSANKALQKKMNLFQLLIGNFYLTISCKLLVVLYITISSKVYNIFIGLIFFHSLLNIYFFNIL